MMTYDTYFEVNTFTMKIRVKCRKCDKVVFNSEESAKFAAKKITENVNSKKPQIMRAVLGDCGYWHVRGKNRK